MIHGLRLMEFLSSFNASFYYARVREAAASKINSEAERDLFEAKKARSNPGILFCEWFLLQEVQEVRITVEPNLTRAAARHPAAQRGSEVNGSPLTS